MDTSFHLFPEQASTLASQVDALYFFLLAFSGSVSVLIAALIIYSQLSIASVPAQNEVPDSRLSSAGDFLDADAAGDRHVYVRLGRQDLCHRSRRAQ